jgi:hypothetical protein
LPQQPTQGSLLYPLRIYHEAHDQVHPPEPLTPAVFHILLALLRRERHGYDMIHSLQQVKEDSRRASSPRATRRIRPGSPDMTRLLHDLLNLIDVVTAGTAKRNSTWDNGGTCK